MLGYALALLSMLFFYFARFHWIMYVFGAILIFTVRFDPFIVYTSNIFAILGLRSMYLLLLQSRLKVIHRGLLGFALVLLSMFFFFYLLRAR